MTPGHFKFRYYNNKSFQVLEVALKHWLGHFKVSLHVLNQRTDTPTILALSTPTILATTVQPLSHATGSYRQPQAGILFYLS